MPLSLKLIRENYPYPKMDIEQYFVDDKDNSVKAGFILFGKNKFESDVERANDCLELKLNERSILLATF